MTRKTKVLLRRKTPAIGALVFALEEKQGIDTIRYFLESLEDCRVSNLKNNNKESIFEIVLARYTAPIDAAPIVQCLVEHDAAATGLPSLHYAILMLSLHSTTVQQEKTLLSIIQHMLNNGADVHQQDSNGWTPLIYATLGQVPLECIKMLLDHGADKKSGPLNGQMNPLYIASSNLNFYQSNKLKREHTQGICKLLLHTE